MEGYVAAKKYFLLFVFKHNARRPRYMSGGIESYVGKVAVYFVPTGMRKRHWRNARAQFVYRRIVKERILFYIEFFPLFGHYSARIAEHSKQKLVAFVRNEDMRRALVPCNHGQASAVVEVRVGHSYEIERLRRNFREVRQRGQPHIFRMQTAVDQSPEWSELYEVPARANVYLGI